jgi:LmbE family N-acetylglucosaminyl deacetylase
LARFDNPTIVLITDGSPKDITRATQLGFGTRKAYAMARKAELLSALDSLQLGEYRLHFLDHGDQDAVFHIPDIAKSLAKVFSAQRINTVITHAFEGGHPDHDTTAFAVFSACELLRRASYRPPAIIEMPLYHAWGGSVFYQSFCPGETITAISVLASTSSRCFSSAVRRSRCACSGVMPSPGW